MRREITSSKAFSGIIFLFLFGVSACQSSQEIADNKTIAVVTTPKTSPTETANSSPANLVGENKNAASDFAKPSPSSVERPDEEIPPPQNQVEQNPVGNSLVDIAKLANRSPGEIDKLLGQAVETKGISVPKPGVYRVYKIAGEPKGLAIRFYGGEAKNFNVVLSAPVGSAKEALKKTLGIDVGNNPPTKDAKEPLSEKWSGEFGGVKFSNVYAKRQSANGGFVFVLAEVAE